MAFINYNTKNRVTIFPGVHSAMEHSEQITYGHVKLDEGTVVPIHNHVHEQWTLILEGQMEFTLNGEKQLLTSGMGAFIPSNAPHGAVAGTACTGGGVFTPVREDYKKLWVRNWEFKSQKSKASNRKLSFLLLKSQKSKNDMSAYSACCIKSKEFLILNFEF